MTATAPATRPRARWRAPRRWRAAAIVAGCRFFAGLPDDAVHRGARALRHACCPTWAACASTPSRSSKPSAWRGARSRPARAPRPARPARASRSCRSRSPRSRSPSCRSSSSTWRAASRTTTRRRAAAATATTATSCSRRRTSARASSSCSSRSTSPTSGATRSLIYGDYLLAHTQEALAIEPIEFPELPAEGLGGRRLALAAAARAGSGHAARRRQGRPARARPGGQGAVHRDEDPADGARGARRDAASSTTRRR